MPKSLHPQHVVQRFCSAENGTTLRVWNRHQSLLHLREIWLVSNIRFGVNEPRMFCHSVGIGAGTADSIRSLFQ